MMDEKSNLKDDLVVEIKQEPESLDMTPLASIKSIIRQALGYDDLTPIDLTKHISVALRSSSGSNAIAEREADSDILRFFAGGEYPATSLKVSIVPVQEGTGDPSPENIRPITGWTAVKVYQAAEYDEEAEPVLEIALEDDAGTVYGGTLDVVTGVLTVTHVIEVFQTANLTFQTTGTVNTTFRFSVQNDRVVPYPYSTDALIKLGYLSDVFPVSGSGGLAGAAPLTIRPENNGFNRNNYVTFPPDVTTAEEAAAIVSSFQYRYPLVTPLTFELDPEEELSTLVGENNIWADCGPVESITY